MPRQARSMSKSVRGQMVRSGAGSARAPGGKGVTAIGLGRPRPVFRPMDLLDHNFENLCVIPRGLRGV